MVLGCYFKNLAYVQASTAVQSYALASTQLEFLFNIVPTFVRHLLNNVRFKKTDTPRSSNILISIENGDVLTANIFESGPMPTP
jgi:hypothetical protein